MTEQNSKTPSKFQRGSYLFSRVQASGKGLFPLCLSLVHWLLTFFTDSFIFRVPVSSNPFDYIICKLIVLFILFFFYKTLFHLLSPNRKHHTIYSICKASLPYLIPMAAVLIFKLPQGFLSNDETIIYDAAIHLEHYTWFTYLTVYYYIVSLMLLPFWAAPIILKVLFQIFVCGYCVNRLNNYISKKYGIFIYFIFLLFPVLAYTTSAHRLPLYFLLYLFVSFCLLMDHVEGVSLTVGKVFFLILASALLTQWRTEGIYLFLFMPILLLLVYPELRTKKKVGFFFFIYFSFQYIISIPQNGILPLGLDAQANNRMGPFYAYTITNMYRNGLDLEKNKKDLENVDPFLSIEAIEKINEYYEDINYEDVLILYEPNFIGTREGSTPEDYTTYTSACKNIFLNNIDVFIKTRWGAFLYSALPYHIVLPDKEISSYLSSLLSFIKTLSYCLFLPCFVLLSLWIYSIVKKRIYTFFFTSGLLCHWFLVFVLAPASYFKYYFPIYIMGYTYLFLLFLQWIYNYFHQETPISFLL